MIMQLMNFSNIYFPFSIASLNFGGILSPTQKKFISHFHTITKHTNTSLSFAQELSISRANLDITQIHIPFDNFFSLFFFSYCFSSQDFSDTWNNPRAVIIWDSYILEYPIEEVCFSS